MSDFELSSTKKYRDWLLFTSDWTQLPDAPCDAEAWAAYRQQLRDLPEPELAERRLSRPAGMIVMVIILAAIAVGAIISIVEN